jgi:hypothetical protein
LISIWSHFLRWFSAASAVETSKKLDAAYRQARRAAFAQTIARLQQGSSAAATTLMKLMMDTATPPSTRAHCSEAIINLSSKAIELEDIEARLGALEQAVEASKHSR